MNATDLTGNCDFVDDLLGDFLDESDDLLSQLNQNLLQLDEWAQSLSDGASQPRDDVLLNEMFRAAHSLKGLSAMLGFDEITGLTHKVENVFDAARNNQLSITSDVVELIFQAVDGLDAMVTSIKDAESCEVNCENVLEGIRKLLDDADVDTAQASQEDLDNIFGGLSSDPEPKPARGLPVDATSLRVSDDVDSDPVTDGAERVAGEVEDCNRSTGEGPAASGGACDAIESPSLLFHSPRATMAGDTSPALESAEYCAHKTDAAPDPPADPSSSNSVDSAGASLPDSEAPGKAVQGDTSKKPSETMRVDVARLDRLMNLAGQLVTSKVRFAKVGETLKSATVKRGGSQSLKKMQSALECLRADMGSRTEEVTNVDLERSRRQLNGLQVDLEIVHREFEQLSSVRSSVGDLSQALHDLERVSNGIQKTVMDARMVAIGPLFTRFHRVVRDIARIGGKEIELVISGENTELDKRTIDELGDPLTHLIRNSADHGIEAPDARVIAHKHRQGTVTLTAFHRGNSIVIQVADDGKGLDVNKIRAKAIEKGIVSEADSEQLSDDDVHQLIWEPGFTTAERVTDVSGRGMGMDIVRSKIEALSGTIELESTRGAGSTFTISLPLTMAIMPSLLVEVDDDVFAIPIESVVEIVRIASQDLATVHGKRTATVRGQPISLVDLSQLFAWSSTRPPALRIGGEDAAVVIIRDGRREIGIVVDRLLGEDDIVVKSLAENYRNVEGVAGANILGDGKISLILDVNALVAMSLQQQS